jgi:hypothetical protein
MWAEFLFTPAGVLSLTCFGVAGLTATLTLGAVWSRGSAWVLTGLAWLGGAATSLFVLGMWTILHYVG